MLVCTCVCVYVTMSKWVPQCNFLKLLPRLWVPWMELRSPCLLLATKPSHWPHFSYFINIQRFLFSFLSASATF